MTNRRAVSPQTLTPIQIFGTLALCAATLLPLAGCGVATPITSGAVPATTAITGRVHGGRQPVIGATITLYAPGTSGYGSAPTAIVTTTTDSQGNFTLPRPYTCPANSPVTYILATGGDPGAGTNQYLAEAALLPACSSLTASTYVYISEVTTVAAAYALAPFAMVTATATNIGTSSTNLLGLTNALGPASNLASTATGQAMTSGNGIIPPTAEINTLADILSACVNTNTVAGTSGTCASLFTAATPPGPNAVAPTDTFQAAIDIALNPGNNAAALYALSTAIAPYQPTLPTPGPTDFAVGIQYTGGLIATSSGTTGIDINSAGNVWVAALGNPTTGTLANITEISPAGLFISGANGYLNGNLGAPYGIAIDNSDQLFAVDHDNSSIAKCALTGAFISYLHPTSLSGPAGIAIDNLTSTSWVTNFGYSNSPGFSVSRVTAAGADATGSPYVFQNAPIGVAIDNSGTIWSINSNSIPPGTGTGSLTRFLPNGSGYTQGSFPIGINTYPIDDAIDASGNIWITSYPGVTQFNNAGTQTSPLGGFSQNFYTASQSVIVDGLSRAWVSNTATDRQRNVLNLPGSVTAFNSNGTLISTSSTTTSAGPFLGYTAAGAIPQQPFAPQGLKIDPSGNLWIAGSNATGAQVVTELVGIAAPVITPLSVAVATAKLGTRP
jgi:hypothetical protein